MTMREFDLEFYKSFYPDVASFADEDILIHFTDYGAAEGRHPNLRAYLNAETGSDDFPNNFIASVYLHLNPDLKGMFNSDWEVALHYARHGCREGRQYKFEDEDFLLNLYGENFDKILMRLQEGEMEYSSIDNMLNKNGIDSRWILTQFSQSDYLIISGEKGLYNIEQCLRHFLEVGIFKFFPISLDQFIDLEFYRLEINADPNITDAEIYRHWLNDGGPSGRAPNPSAFMRSLGLRDVVKFPDGFDASHYEALNPDLSHVGLTRWQLLGHLVLYGLNEKRPGCPPPATAIEIYLAVGDRLSISGDLEGAKELYEVVLTHDPNNGIALQHYGDCMLKLSQYYSAAVAYNRVIELEKANVWTYYNKSVCLREVGNLKAEIETLADLHRLHTGDVWIKEQLQQAIDRNFNTLYQKAQESAALGLKSTATDYMHSAIESTSAEIPFSAVLKSPVAAADIAIVAEMSLPQCKLYRVQQKIDQLKYLGHKVHVFDVWKDMDSFLNIIPSIAVSIFYRVPGFPNILSSIDAARVAGVTTYYDIDDLIFDPQYYPDSFESYGGQITAQEYAGLVTGTFLYHAAMARCDYGIASTPALAVHMESIVRNQKVFIHRNGLGDDHRRWLDRQGHDEGDGVIRIFYGTGTRAHNEDFDLLATPALVRILREFSSVRIFIMGYLTLPNDLLPFSNRISVLNPCWDLDTYWGVLQKMDINLSILQQNEISHCKSEIKWLEAGMLGIPSVLPKTKTLCEAAEEGKYALLYDSHDSLYEEIKHLVTSRKHRKEIGENALRKVVSEYNLELLAQNLNEILSFTIPSQTTGSNKRKLKVVIVNVYYPPQAIGGATRVVADNIDDFALAHDLLDVEVFTTTEGGRKPYSVECYSEQGIRVTAVTAPSNAYVDKDPYDPKMAATFGAYLDLVKPDLVHFHCIQRLTAAVCDAAFQRKIPYIITAHDGWWISDEQFLLDSAHEPAIYDLNRGANLLERKGAVTLNRMNQLYIALTRAAVVLPVSREFAKIYEEFGLKNIQVVENGVSALEVIPHVPSASGKVRIAHIGGAAVHKGYSLLKAAVMFTPLDNIELIIMDHALPPGAEKKDRWGTTNVIFRARLPQAQVNRLYAEIDVLAAPSLWPESYGLVTREALSSGCWVIASDQGAIGNGITKANGFRIDVSNTSELIEVLRKIDKDPSRYLRQISHKPKLRRCSQQAKELLEVYRRICKAD